MAQAIYVWDRFVRFFHWSLVLLFVTSYFSGEEEHWIHVYSGYAILVLLALRIIWGFTGSQYARFRDFLYAPRKVIAYLKALLSGQKPARYIGHNPAGGMMVLVMFLTLSIIGFSGLKLYAIEEGKGPLASGNSVAVLEQAYASSDDEAEHGSEAGQKGKEHDDEEEDFWEEIHETAVNFMILLVLLHILGVFLSSRAHGESLLRAMITGYKNTE